MFLYESEKHVKISIGFFMRLDQQTLKYTQKNTCPVMTKIILKKSEKGHALSDIKRYSKTINSVIFGERIKK